MGKDLLGIKGRTGLACVAAAAMLAVMSGAAVAVGTIPDADGVIHGCYVVQQGQLRVVEDADACTRGEEALSWNQTGPQGAPGPQGLIGPQGPPGVDGAGEPETPPQPYRGRFQLLVGGDAVPLRSFAGCTTHFVPVPDAQGTAVEFHDCVLELGVPTGTPVIHDWIGDLLTGASTIRDVAVQEIRDNPGAQLDISDAFISELVIPGGDVGASSTRPIRIVLTPGFVDSSTGTPATEGDVAMVDPADFRLLIEGIASTAYTRTGDIRAWVPKMAGMSGQFVQYQAGPLQLDPVLIAGPVAGGPSPSIPGLQQWSDDAVAGSNAVRDATLVFCAPPGCDTGHEPLPPVLELDFANLVPVRGLDPFSDADGDRTMDADPEAFAVVGNGPVSSP